MALPQALSNAGKPTLTIDELENIIAAVIPTDWVKLTLGAKAEEGSAKNVAVRTEANLSIARLRGSCVIKAAEELKVGETLATLPAGYRPPTNPVVLQANKLEITTAGLIKATAAFTEGATVSLDGVVVPLT